MTSTFSLFIRLMARFEGVPPNRSVRMMTPLPWSQRWMASAMSLRRILHVVVGVDANALDRLLGADDMLHGGDELGREPAVGHQH